jgi:hypothetical protein
MATKSRPISAALAPAPAAKKPRNEVGTKWRLFLCLPAPFPASYLVPQPWGVWGC